MQKSKKIVVLGHFGVGKTSLIRRFVEDSFSDNYKVTIGVHITKKAVELSSNERLSFIIWDLEGTDELHTIREAYLLGTHGVIFVFDITRPSTFGELFSDLNTVRSKVGEIPVLVVGNKQDLVDANQTKTLLIDQGVVYDILTSAKTGKGVDDLFLKMANQLMYDA